MSLAFALLLLAAPPERYGGTLGLYADETHAPWARAVLDAAVHEPLFDASGAPQLAAGPLEYDGRVVRLRLRPGLLRHDGQPFTATDVADWLHRLARPDSARAHLVRPLAGAAARLEGKRSTLAVEVSSPTTLQVKLAFPYPHLQALWSGPSAGVSVIAPPRAQVGTGPFTLDDHPLGAQAFARHREGRPYLDGLELRRATAFALDRLAARGDALVFGAGLPCVGLQAFLVLEVSGPLAHRATLNALQGAVDRSRLTTRFLPEGSTLVRRFLGAALRPEAERELPAREAELFVAPDVPGGAALAQRIQLDLIRKGLTATIVEARSASPPLRLELRVRWLSVPSDPVGRFHALMALLSARGRLMSLPADRWTRFGEAPAWLRSALVERTEAEVRAHGGWIPLARLPVQLARPTGLGSACLPDLTEVQRPVPEPAP